MHFANQRPSLLKKTFDCFDADKNGLISPSDLRQTLNLMLASSNDDDCAFTEQDMEMIVDVAFDGCKEGNPSVCLEKFMSFLLEEDNNHVQDDELRVVFDSLDVSKRGTLRPEELKDGMERLGMDFTEEEWKSIQRMTQNQEIDFDQFCTLFLEQ